MYFKRASHSNHHYYQYLEVKGKSQEIKPQNPNEAIIKLLFYKLGPDNGIVFVEITFTADSTRCTSSIGNFIQTPFLPCIINSKCHEHITIKVKPRNLKPLQQVNIRWWVT